MTQILPSRSVSNETLTYYVSPSGEYRLAPDSRITDPSKLGMKGWHCFEAKTAKEKDAVALALSRQLYERKKRLDVSRRMREAGVRNMLRANAKIRMAKSPSLRDYKKNQDIIAKMDKDEADLLKILSEEFDPSRRTSGLEMEFSSAPLGRAARYDKRQGLSL